MSNRRFAVYEIRSIISRMRLGKTDRQISRTGLMGRNKAAALRPIAVEQPKSVSYNIRYYSNTTYFT